MMRWLVTGFGPFGSVVDNPSQKLAERSGQPHQVIEVGFRAVDAFVDSLDADSWDALLHIGVSSHAKLPVIEMLARNRIGAVPDVHGEVWGPAPVRLGGPGHLAATLWQGPELWAEPELWGTSVDPGCYLCNYVFYRSLERFEGKPVGFLHVPTEQSMPLEEQQRRLELLLARCEFTLDRTQSSGSLE